LEELSFDPAIFKERDEMTERAQNEHALPTA
jgi:hypothetical protein